MTATRLKSELWVASYGFPKFFGLHWLRTMWHPRESTSCVLSPSSFIHGGSPSIVRSHDWTQSSSNTQTSNTQAKRKFNTSTFRHFDAERLLTMHETFRSPELSKSRKLATWFPPSGLLGLSIMLHPKSSGVPKSRLSESWSPHQPLWLGMHISGADT
jgi:hypothetical protein